MKSGSLRRSSPEVVRAWRDRSQPLRSRPRRLTAAERDARDAVFARDGFCLLAHHSPCFGPPTFHHRRKAGQGGAYSVENGALLCSGHNCALEADADLAAYARSIGLVLRREDVA